MTQGHSVRVKKWTQLRPEDFNGTSSASLNARRRHTASPEPPTSSSSSSSPADSPPASPLSSSSPAHPSYVYHQHVYYQSPPRSSPPSPLRHYSHDYDSPLPSWRDQHDNSSSLLLPSPTSSPESSSSRRAFRHTPEDHLYNPYSRPSSRGRTTRSSPSPSQWNDHSLPSYELHSPPTSPRSPILSSPSRYSKSWKQDVNPLVTAVEEDITVPESQDSVVPSVQKMKICNLILN